MCTQVWRQLQQRDCNLVPSRADKGMQTLEVLTETFPLSDPKVALRRQLRPHNQLRCCAAVQIAVQNHIRACTTRLSSRLSIALLLQDERMQSMMEDLRAKFKAVAAMLGLLDKYFPPQKGSASLDF